ncbi:MAG: class I tRNA ligase family protein, partial [bacterium]|nr:class I tRNA ligase family protein [bacterium]
MAKQEEKNEGKKSPQALREEEILKFWQEKDIFKKTESKGEKDFIFYDGPPFANGLPHYGHILAGTIKDAIPRYQVMQGKKLRRRWGWDCHGLPVENMTEKELGLKGKKAIEEYGIQKFNEATRVNIMRDAGVWKEQVPRLGRFVDMENDYKTMDSSYTESVWWAFKTLYDKKLIYKGFKAMHLCPRCGTTLSNFEVNQGYKDIIDISVTVKFELHDTNQRINTNDTNEEKEKTYLLAWTTTPWTLPGNFALAINPEIEYVKITDNQQLTTDKKEFYILAKDRLGKLKDKFQKPEIIEEFKGKDLVGKSYKPLFDYYVSEDFENKENAWKIYG